MSRATETAALAVATRSPGIVETSPNARLVAAPYSRKVQAAKRDTVRLYAGTGAWDRGGSWNELYPGAALVLPPDADPEALAWPVAGREVLVIAPGVAPERLDGLLAALVRDGARQAIAAERSDGRGAGPEDLGPLTVLCAEPEVSRG